jgi:hypothetical protein
MEIETIERYITKLSSNTVEDIKCVLNHEDFFSRIAIAAYYKAEARGYEPGHEIQDWQEAEAEILHQN